MHWTSLRPPDCFSPSPTPPLSEPRAEFEELLAKLERPKQAKQVWLMFKKIEDARAHYVVKVVGSAVILTCSELKSMADWSFVDKAAAHRFAHLIPSLLPGHD